MKEQQIYNGNVIEYFKQLSRQNGLANVFCVCGKNVAKTVIGDELCKQCNVKVVYDNFKPNPQYESIVEAVNLFEEKKCDSIIAIGGGSAMDLAKCVKAYAGLDVSSNLLQQKIEDNGIPLYVIPATAGTGSEATSFAVIYQNGEKKSVDSQWILPEVIFYDESLLTTLSLYNKKVTFLDAFCHCVESYWSIGANDVSRDFAAQGLTLMLEYYEGYLDNDEESIRQMQKASYFAGKAINLSKTTAAHAMSYKITSIYGEPHGGAVARCLLYVWEYTYKKAIDTQDHILIRNLNSIARIMGIENVELSIQRYNDFLQELDVLKPLSATDKQIEELTASVNVERMKNHPVSFSKNDIYEIYRKIFKNSNY